MYQIGAEGFNNKIISIDENEMVKKEVADKSDNKRYKWVDALLHIN